MAKSPTKSVKSTKAELAQRVSEILGLLSSGYTRSHIVQFSAKKFGVNARQADQYIALASKELLEVNQVSIAKVSAQLKRKLWETVRSADKHSDRIAALKELARIHGIGSTNLNISVDDSRELANLSDDELAAYYGSSKDTK